MEINRSRGIKIFDAVNVLLRVGLGGLFLASSLAKIRQPYDFLSNVYGYELAGPKLGMLAAMVLPWLELILGVCLIGGIFVGGALLFCFILTCFFTFVQASALHRGLSISCGCFNASGSGLIDYTTLIRSLFLLLGCLITWFYLIYRMAPTLRR